MQRGDAHPVTVMRCAEMLLYFILGARGMDVSLCLNLSSCRLRGALLCMMPDTEFKNSPWRFKQASTHARQVLYHGTTRFDR